jgi:DNA-directed RNA polymerase subunit RPC12/RpoP
MVTTSVVSLKVIPASTTGRSRAVSAPPVIVLSSHSVDYVCGKCKTILLHAEEGQVHNVLIRCKECGSYNSTDT